MSLDVVSMFTRVSTDQTLTVVWDYLAADPPLEEGIYISIGNLIVILTFCVQMTYLGMESYIYQQEVGLAMGLQLFTVLANIYV